VKVKDLDIGELTVTLSPSAEFDKVTHSGLFLAIDTHFAKLFRPFERSEPLDLESGGPPSFEPPLKFEGDTGHLTVWFLLFFHDEPNEPRGCQICAALASV